MTNVKLTDDQQNFFEEESLSALEWNGTKKLGVAINDFMPLAKFYGLGETTAERLVSIGIAEKGTPPRQYASRGYTVGYKLSTLGWAILDRGQHVKPRKKS